MAKFESLPPVESLLAEFEMRRAKNASYSLRAFAKQLGLSPGRLSEFLSGKRKLNKPNCLKLASGLGLTPSQTDRWLKDCGHGETAKAQPLINKKTASYTLLAEDNFHFIADWEHFAILTFLETDVADKSERSICERLGLKELTGRAALNRLMRLSLVSKQENNQYQKETPSLTTTTDIPSAALRRSHKQSLEQAIQSLENVPIELRDITSITIPTNPAKIKLAKKMIKDFRLRLAAMLEEGEKSEVYNLNIQLTPITKVSNKGKV